jgi:hypothetical protein
MESPAGGDDAGQEGELDLKSPTRASKTNLIAGGLFSVTALRKNDHERVTVYTKHQLTLQALETFGC